MIPALCLALPLVQGAPERAAPPLPAPAVEELGAPGGPGASLANLARGDDGVLYASWVEEQGGDAVLSYATLGESGWSAPREIARGGNWFLNWADFPVLQALADGTLLASWLVKSGEATYAYDAVFSLSTDHGTTWTSPQPLHEDRAPVEHGFVSLVALDAERFGAVWLDGRATAEGGPTALFFRTVGRTGALGPERSVDARVCDCCPTSLVRGATGLAAAYRDRSADEVRDVGVARGAAVPVAAGLVHADAWRIDGCPVNGPRLAALGDELAAAWFTGAGDAGGAVRVAFAGAQGGFGAPLGVDEGAPEGRVDVVFLAPGRVLVTWLAHRADGSVWRARELRADGRAGRATTLAEVPSGRRTGHLRMAADGAGALALWSAPEGGLVCARLTPGSAGD